jgi:hypothetical protein
MTPTGPALRPAPHPGSLGARLRARRAVDPAGRKQS